MKCFVFLNRLVCKAYPHMNFIPVLRVEMRERRRGSGLQMPCTHFVLGTERHSPLRSCNKKRSAFSFSGNALLINGKKYSFSAVLPAPPHPSLRGFLRPCNFVQRPKESVQKRKMLFQDYSAGINEKQCKELSISHF